MAIDASEIKHIHDTKRTLFVRHYPGYFYCRELIDDSHYGGDGKLEIVCCYSDHNGHYMGNARAARFLCKKRDLRKIQLASSSHSVCSIGYSESQRKWYGWSHRAICGFGIGDMLFSERYLKSDKTPFVKAGKIKITKMVQAKEAARRFAGSVS